MLVFIDESGHPLPGDSATKPVLLAVCIREQDAGRLARAMFSLRRALLSKMTLSQDEEEGKAVEFLNRHAIMKVVTKREYVESLFEFLRDFELTVFAVVMERPNRTPYRGSDLLQTHYIWLLQRIERFMERDHPTAHAIPIFDGQDPTSNRNFSACFTGFMMRADAGRALLHIVPTPLFVDSSLTPGIQIADLFAYVTRMSHEKNLHQVQTVADPYLSAIKRYATIARQKTINYEVEEGFSWYGIATMDASKFYYAKPEAGTLVAAGGPPAEVVPGPSVASPSGETPSA